MLEEAKAAVPCAGSSRPRALRDTAQPCSMRATTFATAIPERTRFDTARLWRTKARILTLMGRETDAQHARETAAKLDPTR